MGTNTPNHDFYVPDSGETDWGAEVGGSFEDLDTAVVLKDTLTNRPDAGTANRWFLATDTLDLFYDDGAAWNDMLADVGDADTLDGEEGAHYLAHANLTDVTADQHHSRPTAGTALTESGGAFNVDATAISHDDLADVSSSDHHVRFTSAEAEDAINADADHGSTASHDYYTNADAETHIGGTTPWAEGDLDFDPATQSELDTHEGTADAHHTRPSAGEGLDDTSNTFSLDVVASGQTTLSSGEATVDTSVSAADATFMLALGVDDPDADCEVAGRLFWDDSAGTYHVTIVEQETAVGNPTVNYDIVRVS